MPASTVVLGAERPADAASAGAAVSLPRPSGQLVAPQQRGHLRHRATRCQVIKTHVHGSSQLLAFGLTISVCHQGPDQRDGEDAGPHEGAGSHHQRGSRARHQGYQAASGDLDERHRDGSLETCLFFSI